VSARGSLRVDPTGLIKQTTSGRIEMQVTRNFSVVMDEDTFNEMQRHKLKDNVDTTERYTFSFMIQLCLVKLCQYAAFKSVVVRFVFRS